MNDTPPAPESTASEPKPSKSIVRSSAIVSAMTMLSRILGLARDVLFARFIGADGAADAFFIAFKIPNFLRRLFAEGAFAQAFVPVLSEFREKGSKEAVQNFIDRVAGCLGVSLLTVTVLVVIAAPLVAAIFGMGYLVNPSPEKFALTTDLLRITFPYLLLISLTGFAGSILNSYDQFAVPAITPIFLNICLITAAAVVSPMLDVPAMALAWGVLVAGTIQLCFQLPFLVRLGLMPHPKVDWGDESIRKVLKLMAPAMFGVSVSQINLMFDTILATFLPTGSPSWLYYSDRLTELPLGVFGIAIATVILPSLSRKHISGCDSYSATVDWGLRIIFLIALPATIALFILAEPILFTLFQYGSTTVRDIGMSAYSLQAYAVGLTAFMLIKVLASAHFSRQDTKTPVKIGIIAMLSNMVLNVIFVLPSHYFWSIGHAGLALATSISALLNAALLYRALRKQGAYLPGSGWGKFGAQVFAANTAMLGFLIWSTPLFGSFVGVSWESRVFYVALLCMVGLVVYTIALLAVGVRPKDLKPTVT